MSIEREKSIAVIYDLLSQTERLDSSQLPLLQENLKQLGFDPGIVDGIMGKNTAGAVAEFLSEEQHQDFAPQISEHIQNQIVQYGQGDIVTRIQLQTAMATDDVQNNPSSQIDILLGQENLNNSEMTVLQDLLKEAGYSPGISDGYFGTNTACAIVKYLKDNPSSLLEVNTSHLQDMMEYGQSDALKELAENNQEILDTLIQTQLTKMGADADMSVLRRTTDYDAVYKLQTLLSIGGYDPGGLDGIIGNNTLGAVEKFKADATIADEPQPEPDSIIQEPASPNAETESTSPPETTSPRTSGTIISQNVTKLYDGDNGYGVSNLAIEKAWSRITGDDIPAEYRENEITEINENTRPLIVIDMGHGSDIGANNVIDNGAVSKDGLTEVDVVDPLSAAMAKRLYAQGYQVAFTRNPGEQLRVEGAYNETLRVRPDFAHALSEEVGADSVLFISMHANSFSQESANGTRIYVDVDNASMTNENSGNLANSLTETFSISNRESSLKQTANLSVIDRFENGVNDRVSAGVLVELGFLSNLKDAEALANIRDNPEETAAKIVDGIDGYVQSVRPVQQDRPENTLMSENNNAPVEPTVTKLFEPS